MNKYGLTDQQYQELCTLVTSPEYSEATAAATRELEHLRRRAAWADLVEQDLRALVANSERHGGMQVPWFHELAGAVRLPSVVGWARSLLNRLDNEQETSNDER